MQYVSIAKALVAVVTFKAQRVLCVNGTPPPSPLLTITNQSPVKVTDAPHGLGFVTDRRGRLFGTKPVMPRNDSKPMPVMSLQDLENAPVLGELEKPQPEKSLSEFEQWRDAISRNDFDFVSSQIDLKRKEDPYIFGHNFVNNWDRGRGLLFFVKTAKMLKLLIEIGFDKKQVDKNGDNLLIHLVKELDQETFIERNAESAAEESQEGDDNLHMLLVGLHDQNIENEESLTSDDVEKQTPSVSSDAQKEFLTLIDAVLSCDGRDSNFESESDDSQQHENTDSSGGYFLPNNDGQTVLNFVKSAPCAQRLLERGGAGQLAVTRFSEVEPILTNENFALDFTEEAFALFFWAAVKHDNSLLIDELVDFLEREKSKDGLGFHFEVHAPSEIEKIQSGGVQILGYEAFHVKSLKVLKKLIKLGFDPNTYDTNGHNLLLNIGFDESVHDMEFDESVETRNNMEMFNFLVNDFQCEDGSKIHINHKSKTQRFALIGISRFEQVDLLMRNGANVKLQSVEYVDENDETLGLQGETALEYFYEKFSDEEPGDDFYNDLSSICEILVVADLFFDAARVGFGAVVIEGLRHLFPTFEQNSQTIWAELESKQIFFEGQEGTSATSEKKKSCARETWKKYIGALLFSTTNAPDQVADDFGLNLVSVKTGPTCLDLALQNGHLEVAKHFLHLAVFDDATLAKILNDSDLMMKHGCILQPIILNDEILKSALFKLVKKKLVKNPVKNFVTCSKSLQKKPSLLPFRNQKKLPKHVSELPKEVLARVGGFVLSPTPNHKMSSYVLNKMGEVAKVGERVTEPENVFRGLFESAAFEFERRGLRKKRHARLARAA